MIRWQRGRMRDTANVLGKPHVRSNRTRIFFKRNVLIGRESHSGSVSQFAKLVWLIASVGSAPIPSAFFHKKGENNVYSRSSLLNTQIHG